jgi:hypothetical protein
VDAAWVTLSLAVYGVLSQEVGATIEAADCELLARQERVIHFNGLLKKHCAELGVEYIDIFDEMTEGALLATYCYVPLTTTCHLLLLATNFYLPLTTTCYLPPPYRLPTASLPPPMPSSLPPWLPPPCRPLPALRYHASLPPHCPPCCAPIRPRAGAPRARRLPRCLRAQHPPRVPACLKGPRGPCHSSRPSWWPLGRRQPLQ